jgi:4-hydroxybenzoyl-CoA thioesterase
VSALVSTTVSTPYRAKILVRFAHCDAAGIVFYPRYMEMFNELVEDWFRESLGYSFREMHRPDSKTPGENVGIPTVRLEVDFTAPSELGDVLDAELTVREMHNSSFVLTIVLHGANGKPRVSGRLVLVFLDLTARRAIPIPERVRGRMAAHLIPLAEAAR